MGTNVQLTAEDGHRLDAYLHHVRDAKMAVVVLQEIFGVNHHIRTLVDRFAAEGFTAIAPALFDRARPHAELAYDQAGVEEGRKMAFSLPKEKIILDVGAAIGYVRRETGGGRVGVVGYCFGGTYAWLAATRLRPQAAVGYYGGQIAANLDEAPHCPVLLHFGAKDAHIPVSDVDKIRAAHPEIPIYVYDAGHAFACDERESFVPEASALASKRTLAFFREHLAS